jgi:hypothetical protein
MPVEPITIDVEIFWDGDGWYFAHPGQTERLGGPHIIMHSAWKQADEEGYQVVRAQLSRGKRDYRPSGPEKGGVSNAEKERRFAEYLDAQERRLKPPEEEKKA